MVGHHCCLPAFSRCRKSGRYSSLMCVGFSPWWLLLWSTGSRHRCFSSCGLRALEPRLSSCGPWAWAMLLVACGSSQTRDLTHVPCNARQILNKWLIREAHYRGPSRLPCATHWGQSQSPDLSFPHFLPENHQLVSYICDSFCFVNKFICTVVFRFPWKWYHTISIFLCLIYFIQYDNLWKCICSVMSNSLQPHGL